MKKLTEKQMNVLQIVLGLVAGFLIWFSIGLGYETDNTLLRWLFVIVFAATMLLKNMAERKYGINTRVFIKWYLISLIIFLGLYILYGFVTGQFGA